MRLKLIGLLLLGAVVASVADGSSINITPRKLSASTDGVSGSITRDRIIARIRPASRGSKVTANKNRNLAIIDKSKIKKSTVGMSVNAR